MAPEAVTLIPVSGITINGEEVVKPSTIKFRGVLDGPNVGALIADSIRDAATAIYAAGGQAAIPIAAETAYRAGKDAGLQLAAALAAPMAEVRVTLAELTEEMRRPRVKTVTRDAEGNLASVIESPV